VTVSNEPPVRESLTATSIETIAVTGATGFLGRHLIPILAQRYPAARVVGLSSADYDLMDPRSVRQMLDEIEPDVVIHLAAYSGGIGANRTFPADFYFRNTILTAHMFDAAARVGLRKLIYPMGGCSYPETAASPIVEEAMWDGFPQPDSAGYSAAKKMGIVAGQSYRSQYGLESAVIVPGNLYGEYDNFREAESHVVPAMVRRYVEAKRAGRPFVTMWGTGRAERDFVYAGDVAAMIPFFIEHDVPGPINLAAGVATTIRELAETIREFTGYEGDIQWDSTKPEGQLVKIFSADRMHALGLAAPTSLRDGVQRTIAWFEANYDGATDGLRL
jgi:GDP-L-fucose synthase